MKKIRSLDDLKEIQDQARDAIAIREGAPTKVVVGMGTCGIAAGAREVLSAILDELAQRNIKGVSVTQTGCAGLCQHEPMVEVSGDDEIQVMYGRVTPERARRIVSQHLVNRQIVAEWVLTSQDGQ